MDRIDAVHLEEMLASPGWALYKARLDSIATNMLNELRGDLTEVQSAKIRGYLVALDRARAMPAEMRAAILRS